MTPQPEEMSAALWRNLAGLLMHKMNLAEIEFSLGDVDQLNADKLAIVADQSGPDTVRLRLMPLEEAEALPEAVPIQDSDGGK